MTAKENNVTTTVTGWKGFDKDLKCQGKQYAVGEVAEEPAAKLCSTGIHFVENPIDVFGYYRPADSRYCEVEAEGVTDEHEGDSKRVATKVHIGAEIGLPGLIKAAVQFTLDRVKWDSAATNTGYRSAATNTGDQSAATNTGTQSAATVEKPDSVAMVTGFESKAKGGIGSWLVIAEWSAEPWVEGAHIANVKSVRVDGKRIKAGTFYRLVGGKFVKAA